MHIDWEDLRTIESLVRNGTVVRAAQELGLRHSSISRRVDALERALGTPLFLRGARLRPTALALAIAERAGAMAREARAVESLLLADERTRAERLVITTNDALAPLVFAALAARAPERAVEVRVSDRELELEPGVTDLAVRPGARPAGALRGWRLGRLRVGIYRSHAAPPAPPWILPAAELRGRASMRWWKAVPEAAGASVTCDSLLAMRDACAAGLGRAALPAPLATGDDRLVLDEEVEGGPPVWLLSAATRRAAPGLRRIAEGLAASLRAVPGIWT